MAEVLSTFRLLPGDDAPDFRLPDADGNVWARDEIKGPNGLLVVFVCNHCPYVVHVADALGETMRVFKTDGVGSVAIVSNDLEHYPQDGPAFMKPFAERHGWECPYLIDETQDLALAFGAACTPDFFLFDEAMKLAYAGQFDDTRPRAGLAAHGGDLREAFRRMLADETPLARPYPSSGCNIKWKPGKQPEWWNAGS